MNLNEARNRYRVAFERAYPNVSLTLEFKGLFTRVVIDGDKGERALNFQDLCDAVMMLERGIVR